MMKRIAMVFWISVLGILASPAFAVTPSPSEIQRAAHWQAEHAVPNNLPFSLRVDGVPVRTLEGEAPRFRDIEHHLEFEYSITDPPNSASLEMILEVTNTDTEDSGVIEALFPLDVVFPVAGPRCTLRHVLGDLNSDQSFAPVDEDLPNGMTAPFVIAPVGGRSSDEQMPYFNLNTGNCGVLIAIGWAGQWEAR
ncbi:MAG: hypothetical protein HYV26_19640, partial [Candidatus Hydrogenedentes bacterium]|nr:hypothetical protein [Candidatus Hydrogenedentota bacterium]